MPTPQEICLEDLGLSDDEERYVRCVALPGGQPGLALDRAGAVRWMDDGPGACGLWISADDRLVLLRTAGAAEVTVRRGGRALEAPVGKPVVLLHGDLLELSGRRLQVHVHGVAQRVYAPAPISGSALARLARAASAALALSAAVGAASGAAAEPAGIGPRAPTPIEVRQVPPAPPPMKQVVCTITSQQSKGKQGPLVIQASCPAKSGIYKGASGQIIDPKTKAPLKDGFVLVQKVSGDTIEATAQKLSQKVTATEIRFWVND